MSQSLRRPTICSFCSLLCEVPEEFADPQTSKAFCPKRADRLSLAPRRLNQAVSQGRSFGDSELTKVRSRVAKATEICITGRMHCVESSRSAIEFARHRKALIDPWDSDAAFDSIESLQRVGGYSVSFAEAREHSDLWIIVGDDRLLEQFPRLPVAINPGKSVPILLLGRWSDLAIEQWQQAGFEVICIDSELEDLPKFLSQMTRLGAENCECRIAKWFFSAQYTTILYSPATLEVRYPDLWIDLLNRWVLHRNETTRIATLAWNNLQSTFHQTCTWLTGFPGRVHFENNQITYDPRRNRAKDWCLRHASPSDSPTDSILIWIDDTLEDLPSELLQLRVPVIVIGSNSSGESKALNNWLPTGIAGHTFSVNAFRGDQTLLAKIYPESTSDLVSPSDWLRRIGS